MFLLLVSFLISITIGFMLVLTFLPAKERSATGLVFGLCAGAGLGIGVTSCLYFLVLLLGQMRHIILIEIMIAALLILLWLALIRKKIRPKISMDRALQNPISGMRTILYAVFGGAVLSSLVSLILSFLKDPHGKWDAWLIWNTHARFIFRSGEAWKSMFTSGLDWTHLDYPLMLPLSIVRAWQYAGQESLWVPMAVSLVFISASIGLLSASLSLLRSTGQGLLGGLALMGSPFFLMLGAYQAADIPLAFFVLATLVIFTVHDRFPEKSGQTLILAGLATGLTAWTKNEGLLFLAVVLVVRSVVVVRFRGWTPAGKEFLWFMAGALPVLVILMVFKGLLSPPNDIFSGQTMQDIVGRMMDPARYYEILKAYLLTGMTFTQGVMNIQTGLRFNPGVVGLLLLIIYLIFMGVNVRVYDRLSVINTSLILLAMAGGFFLVYLLTPHNLYWHLTTSLNRLLMQLWPSFLFLFFMAVKTPEQVDMGRVFMKIGAQRGDGRGRKKKTKALPAKGT